MITPMVAAGCRRLRRCLFWRASASPAAAVALLATALLSIGAKAADTTIYSNFSNDLGIYEFLDQSAGSANSALFADDIHFLPAAANLAVDSITFSLTNTSNAAAGTVTPHVEIFALNSVGKPGLLLSAVTLPPVTVAAGQDAVETAGGQNFFAVPTNGTVWAGLYLTYEPGSTGSISFGQRVSNPPTVGSSQAIFFVSSRAAVPGSDPAGSTFSAAGGFNGPVNAQWAFTTTQTVPEPAAWVLLVAGGVASLVPAQQRFVYRRR